MVRVQWSTNSRHPRVRYLPRSVAMTGASRSGHSGGFLQQVCGCHEVPILKGIRSDGVRARDGFAEPTGPPVHFGTGLTG